MGFLNVESFLTSCAISGVFPFVAEALSLTTSRPTVKMGNSLSPHNAITCRPVIRYKVAVL